jgi:hypothetical protein
MADADEPHLERSAKGIAKPINAKTGHKSAAA